MVRVVASKDKRISPGSNITTINDQEIEDFLEFQFYNDISKTRRIQLQKNSQLRTIVYKPNQEIAVTLESPCYRQCDNQCDFCFIKRLPKNLRKELYFRDDDYRLSFLFGNFLSLTNVSDKDIARIARLRLSPLYVSVQTTDPKIRARLFKNEKAADIIEIMKRLTHGGVKMHCQIVVIPGITSGPSLIKTIEDLSAMYPGVLSIGIVPVGKTKYSKGIPSVTKRMARSIIKLGREYQDRFRQKHKRGLVYIADEFFIKTGESIPPRQYYDDLPQYENGIGMLRTFLDETKQIKKVKKTKGQYLFLTGTAAYPFLKILKAKLEPNIKVDVLPVKNHFFGLSVTVSGLLSARDINQTIDALSVKYDRIILPPNCVNEKKQFLDDEVVSDRRALIAPPSIKELLQCLQW
jgi:putative radical SAM enzyme (TIGR03279 family)